MGPDTQIEEMLVRARVEQKKPDYPKLRDMGFRAVDMHVHTRHSDTFTRVKSILRKASKLGIGVAITDHNEINGVLEAFSTDSDVLVIPGIEVSTAEGPHVLAYFKQLKDLVHFYENYVQPVKGRDPHTAINLTIYEMARLCSTYDCLVSIAHPFAIADVGFTTNVKKGFIEGKVVKQVHALEVINGACTKNMNVKSVHYAEKKKKSITGGSDSHSLFEMGKVVTYARADNPADFIEAIKANRNLVAGKEVGSIMRIPSIAKASQHQITHPLTFVKSRYEKMIKRGAKYHAPKAVGKARILRDNSVSAVKNPIKATRRITKTAAKILKK